MVDLCILEVEIVDELSLGIINDLEGRKRKMKLFVEVIVMLSWIVLMFLLACVPQRSLYSVPIFALIGLWRDRSFFELW